jgi:prephenate dehydrogenase
MTERIFVIGTGLIGGSLGLALRRSGAGHVLGFDADPAAGQRALDAGALGARGDAGHHLVERADVVILAAPVGAILPAASAVASSARPGTVVTDVGSTKETIVASAERLLGADRPFVGGHPMAGTDGEGIAAARADLFEGALWILTPTPVTDSSAYRRINTLVTGLGARTLALEPRAHDELVARVSHLPYTIATALMALAGEGKDTKVFDAAAGSFRDVTRTAGTNPRIWHDIFATNANAVADEIGRMIGSLEGMRAALQAGDLAAIDDVIARARDARKRLPLKGERTPATLVTVEVLISDRPGVLAEVMTALGEGGINIEDLSIDHTPALGTLRVVVDGTASATRSIELLGARGYRAAILEES